MTGFNPAQDAYHFMPGGVPVFNSDHVYTFVLDTGSSTASHLHFGVGDGNFSDNAGAYNISITQLGVPEPASWALMLIGVGGMGAALRRSRKTVVT